MGPDPVNIEVRTATLEEEERLVQNQKPGRVVPAYDRGVYTCWVSLAGLGIVWISGCTCIVGASVSLAHGTNFTVTGYDGVSENYAATEYTAQLPGGFRPVDDLGWLYALIVTALLTICTESTGFIHDVSLRWNMFRERRLRWITNLRLVSTSRQTGATSAASNLLYFFTLALAYTASSQIFIPTDFSPANSSAWSVKTLASGAAIITLGVCLLIQAIHLTWIYLASRRNIRTWSSSPLTITLACMSSADGPDRQISQGFSSLTSAKTRIAMRRERSSDYHLGAPISTSPRSVQPSLFSTRRVSSRWVLCIVFVLPILVFVWAGIVLRAYKVDNVTPSFSEFDGESTKLEKLASDTPAIPIGLSYRTSASTATFLGLLLIFSMQSYLTFSLHCIEVLANSVRDQRTWEKASRRARSDEKLGAELNPNIIASSLASWPNLVLITSKIVAHWLFNRALMTITSMWGNKYSTQPVWLTGGTQIEPYGAPTLFLGGLILVLVVLAWYLAFRRPSTYQPSTYGHIDTLMEVIDDWGMSDRLFWGDKGVVDNGQFRRAGTADSADGVGSIHPEADYV